MNLRDGLLKRRGVEHQEIDLGSVVKSRPTQGDAFTVKPPCRTPHRGDPPK